MNVIVLAITALITSLAATAAPFIPRADGTVLEQLPAAPGTTSPAMNIRNLRAQLGRDPANMTLATEVARRFIELGRAEGDPRYYGYAQAALGPWWDQPQPPPPVLILRATLRQNRHDFAGALTDLDASLKRQPGNAQAWLTRAVILRVQGKPRAAAASCAPLVRLSTRLLASACFADALSVMGRGEAAYRLLDRAVAHAANAGTPDQRWALTVLAEIAARLGRPAEAERRFRAALALGIRDIYLLGAYADLLLDQHRPGEVVALLGNETRSDALLLRLALAEHQLQAPGLATHVRWLGERFADNRARGGALHLGNESRFVLQLLGQARPALELALRNWATQKEPGDARLVLEAAVALGDRHAAQPVLDWLAATGLEDNRLERLAARLRGTHP